MSVLRRLLTSGRGRSALSVRVTIFAACAAMGLITAGLGGYGLLVLFAAGRIVVETYDGPLMAINFARAASLDFTQMEKEELRRKLAPADQRAAIDAHIDELTASFSDDLAVAEQRALGADEQAVIADIRRLVTRWTAVRTAAQPDDDTLEAVSAQVVDRFDTLTELTADHSFVRRRQAVWSLSYYTYTSAAALGLVLSLGATITLLLSRKILRPLTAAAAAANRIANGEFDASIPSGGADETGMLLRSMTIMQNNIRAMMARETERRQSAEHRLADAVESAREGIVVVDPKRRIVMSNSQIDVFFPSLAGAFAPGADFARLFARIRPLIAVRGELDDDGRTAEARGATLELFNDGEFQLIDGRWIRLSHNATRDGGFLLLISDFTTIKEREEQLKEARRAADAASAAKSAFLANMSHELRTPLNAIMGFSEVIATELMGAIGPRQYIDYAGDILSSARHLLDIISSVLDMAKAESGKLTLERERVELGSIVDDCVTMVRDQCTRAELKFELFRPASLVVIEGEAAKLRQIIVNLLSNAIKFTPPGGTVWLDVRSGGGVEVRVGDTGIGMTAEEVQVAMTPFGQVESRNARRYPGAGLGLPLTKALVELHGGTMTIESARNEGTVVTILLPRVDAEHVAAGDNVEPASG